jgi:hypothetical protein
MHRSLALLSPLALLTLSLSQPVLAQIAPADEATADALFKEAQQLMAAGNYGAACPKLAVSEHLDPAQGTLLNLGDCLEKTGAVASVFGAFTEAEVLAHKAGDKLTQDEAARRAKLLEGKLPKLAIVVAPEARVPGLAITLDGKPLEDAILGSPLPIDPGDHAVEATAPHKLRRTSTLTVKPGPGTTTVNVGPLVEMIEPPSPSSVAPVKTSTWSPRRKVGLVVGGAGVVGLGIGAAFGIVALAKKADAIADCQPNDARECDPTGLSLRAEGRSAANASTVSFALGGTALAAGILLFATAPAAGSPTGTGSLPRLSKRPLIGLRSGGTALRGEW